MFHSLAWPAGSIPRRPAFLIPYSSSQGQDGDYREALIDEYCHDGTTPRAACLGMFLQARNHDGIRAHRQTERNDERGLPVHAGDDDQKSRDGCAREEILCRSQTDEEAPHRRQVLRPEVETDEEEQQHHADLANGL